MKKNSMNVRMKAAVLAGGWLLAACTSDDAPQHPGTPEPQRPGTYELTLDATKGSDGEERLAAMRRVLTEDGTMILSQWRNGDEVSVYNNTKNQAMSGKLTAQADGQSATLKGALTGEVAVGDQLILSYGAPSYDEQDGTLAHISDVCDYATAVVNVTGIDQGRISVEGGEASFSNHQAILQLKLKDAGGSSLGNVSQLKIYADGHTYTVTPGSPTSSPLYVAVRGISGKRIGMVATVAGSDYKFTKDDVSFGVAKYYRISVKMSPMKKVEAAGAGDKNKLIGADGHIYDTKEEADYYGTTAKATIVYVGTAGSVDASSSAYRGLAIALTDETGSAVDKWGDEMDEVDIASHITMSSALGDLAGISNTAELVKEYGTKDGYIGKAINQFRTSTPHPAGTSDWFIPSLGQWALLLKANGADIPDDSSWAPPFITTTNSDMTTTYGFTQNYYYWTSTEQGTEAATYLSFINDSKVTIGPYTKGGTSGDSPALRPFLAF